MENQKENELSEKFTQENNLIEEKMKQIEEEQKVYILEEDKLNKNINQYKEDKKELENQNEQLNIELENFIKLTKEKIEKNTKEIEEKNKYIEQQEEKILFIKDKQFDNEEKIEELKKEKEINENYIQNKNIKPEPNLNLALKYKEQAAEYFRNQQYTQAIEQYEKSLSLLSETESDLTTKINSNIGICYMKNNNYKQAIPFLDNSLGENPLFIKARVNRAKCFVKINDHENAVKDYVEIEKQDPKLLDKKQYLKSKKLYDQEMEQKKQEVITGLKDLGNKFLGNFGMNLDSFKLNPNGQGGYNVSYQNQIILIYKWVDLIQLKKDLKKKKEWFRNLVKKIFQKKKKRNKSNQLIQQIISLFKTKLKLIKKIWIYSNNQKKILVEKKLKNQILLVKILSKKFRMKFQKIQQKIQKLSRSIKSKLKRNGEIMSKLRSGKLNKSIQILPELEKWKDLINLTNVANWSPHCFYEMTKIFVSKTESNRTVDFFSEYLLKRVLRDIDQQKKIHIHLFKALQKAAYRTASFFKAIIFTFMDMENTTIKQAQVLGSVLQKTSFTRAHLSAALFQALQKNFNASNNIIIKSILLKRFSMAIQVVNAVQEWFMQFQNSKTNQMPILWYKTLEIFCKFYSQSLNQKQKQELTQLLKKKFKHEYFTNEICKLLNRDNNQFQKNQFISQ